MLTRNNTMKKQHVFQILVAAAAGFGLSSCVDPYYAGTTVSTAYRPGYAVTTLPSGYSTVTIGGTRYYHHNDVYYRPSGSGYVVVESPRRGAYGDRDGVPNRYDRRDDRYRNAQIINTLPSGYRVVSHDGRRYYHSGSDYYVSRDNGYVLVPSPF